MTNQSDDKPANTGLPSGAYTHPIYMCTIDDVHALKYFVQHREAEAKLDTQLFERGRTLSKTYRLVYTLHNNIDEPTPPKGYRVTSPPVSYPSPLLHKGDTQTYWIAFRNYNNPTGRVK